MREQVDFQSLEQTDIDVTPFLNVLYILLFFFVIAFSANKNVAIELNKAWVHPSYNPLTILVKVMHDGEVQIQGRKMTHHAVTRTINRLRVDNPGAPVIVKIEAEAKTKYFVRVLDGIRSANVLLPTVYVI